MFFTFSNIYSLEFKEFEDFLYGMYYQSASSLKAGQVLKAIDEIANSGKLIDFSTTLLDGSCLSFQMCYEYLEKRYKIILKKEEEIITPSQTDLGELSAYDVSSKSKSYVSLCICSIETL